MSALFVIILMNILCVFASKNDKTRLGRTVFYLNLVSALFAAIQIYVFVSY